MLFTAVYAACCTSALLIGLRLYDRVGWSLHQVLPDQKNAAIAFYISSAAGRLMYDASAWRQRFPFIVSIIMAKIEIYTSIMCPHCSHAIRLLQSKNVNFEQIDVSMNSPLRQSMRVRTGGHTSVPQIFIDNDHVGGCDDLMALESSGHLDTLLNRSIPWCR